MQVVYRVHVKSRCAWLNHTSEPGVFMRLVHRFPNIKLWFSGHFHVSHNYPGAAEWGGGISPTAPAHGAACMTQGFAGHSACPAAGLAWPAGGLMQGVDAGTVQRPDPR